MVLCHACMKIVRITEGFGPPESPHGGACCASVRFPKEKHGFVPSRDEKYWILQWKMGPSGGPPDYPTSGNLAFVWAFAAFWRGTCMKIVRITEGFGPPESPHGGAMWPKCTFPKRKSMVLCPPGMRILRIVMENGPPGGPGDYPTLGKLAFVWVFV